MRAEKYDWRARMREETESIAAPTEPPAEPWRTRVKQALGIVDPFAKVEKESDWRFGKIIANTICVVRAEQEAERERQEAERAKLEKARTKAILVYDKVIMPLLGRLRDDFAVHEKGVLPPWHVQSQQDADTFLGEAATADADGANRFAIKAEASVAELGEFVNLSVVCSSVDPRLPSASPTTPLFEKKAKFPAVQVFDELGNRAWFHKQVTECVKLCVLTRMRELSMVGAATTPSEGAGEETT